MATDFEALRKDLNVYMGKEANYSGVELFPDYDPMNSNTLMGYVFEGHGLPKEALDREMLLKLATDKLEAHLVRGVGYLAILKRHAAEGGSDGVEADI